MIKLTPMYTLKSTDTSTKHAHMPLFFGQFIVYVDMSLFIFSICKLLLPHSPHLSFSLSLSLCLYLCPALFLSVRLSVCLSTVGLVGFSWDGREHSSSECSM